MKHTLSTIAFFLLSCLVTLPGASAQQLPERFRGDTIPEGYKLADTVVMVPASRLDSTLLKTDVFEYVARTGEGAEAQVYQSAELMDAFRAYLEANKTREIPGYRIRIFFDNKRTSRTDSEATLVRFQEKFPGVKAYRNYVNPFFKVTVGNYRTHTDAMAMLSKVSRYFPSAFVVKENIEFPLVDANVTQVPDTIRYLVRVSDSQEGSEAAAQ